MNSAAAQLLSLGLLVLPAGAAFAENPDPVWSADGQEIPAPLSEAPGDPSRGQEVLRDGSKATCLICHSISALPDRDQGVLGPPLDGIGARSSAASLRARLVDARRLNPDTIMPPYFSQEGLNRIGSRWQGTTIYIAQEVEDVLAYLLTLRE